MNGECPISNPVLPRSSFGFNAGQWVDLFVPNIKQVGGFSLVSTPSQLIKSNTIELAIKHTLKSPIVKHLFYKSLPGDTFFLRTGGNFYYRDQDRPILLIAGGVGIAPLFSIMNHVLETGYKRKIRLLYSYELKEERVFRDWLMGLEEKYANFAVEYFCTEDNEGKRMKESDVMRAFDSVNAVDHQDVVTVNELEKVDVYLCGPPLFESAMLSHLEKLPVKVYHEKWW